MKRYFPTLNLMLMFGLLVLVLPICLKGPSVLAQEKSRGETVKLPSPVYESTVSIEKALAERRSIRSYKEETLTLKELSQILWAAQGITEPTKGLRTAPSPKAVYLLLVYVLPGNVTNLSMGIYQYRPQGHELIKIADGD